MASNYASLKARRSLDHPLTATEQCRSDELFREYLSRPQHRNRLTKELIASLRAAANSVARHGNPPNPQARLAYRMHKKRRARQLAIAIYGDPNAKTTQELIDMATRDVPQRQAKPTDN